MSFVRRILEFFFFQICYQFNFLSLLFPSMLYCFCFLATSINIISTKLISHLYKCWWFTVYLDNTWTNSAVCWLSILSHINWFNCLLFANYNFYFWNNLLQKNLNCLSSRNFLLNTLMTSDCFSNIVQLFALCLINWVLLAFLGTFIIDS